MADYDRSLASAGYPRSASASRHSPTTSRSFRTNTDLHFPGEDLGDVGTSSRLAPSLDTARRYQPSQDHGTEDFLSPLTANNRRNGRARVDSLNSIGSSVSPAALPRWQGRSHTASRHQHYHEGSTGGGGIVPSASSHVAGVGGGLEVWLQSQAVPGGSVPETYTSFAPSGRVRKMQSVDEDNLGSDAGRSVGAKSAGPRMNGTGSGRNKRRESRPQLPEWDPTVLDADAAGLGGLGASNNYSQKLDSVLRWRKESAAKALSREHNDLTDFGAQIAPESRRRRRDVGAGSFSASGLSVLREGVRRPGKLHAEPSLDALVSAARDEARESGMTASRSFSGHSYAGDALDSHRKFSPAMPVKQDIEDTLQTSPLKGFVRWFLFEGVKNSAPSVNFVVGTGTKSLLFTAVLTSIFFKWCTGLGSWSGRGKPPMYGDFEAQRHWIEITLHLPYAQWYYYDLDYWGLDYPPLTAFISRWCGQVAQRIPGLAPLFALDISRGEESALLVVFMRATVLALDLATYTPAVLFFLSRKLQGRGRRTRTIAAFTILLQPLLILVDYGHFQYNTVMLGLSAISFALLYTSLPNPDISSESSAKVKKGIQQRLTTLSRRVSYEYIAAAIFFSASLCFKQMALYYAPAIFTIMLGRCWGLARLGFERGIGLATITTFAVIFSPWLLNISQMGQILHRIFPLARGIFEDKVSNVWCFLSVLPIPARFKLRNVISIPSLAKLSVSTILAVILLPCVHLFVSAAETVRIEMFLHEDAKKQVEASEKRVREGSVAGSTKARSRALSRAALSDAGSDLASILSGGPQTGRATSMIRDREARQSGNRIEHKPAMASSSPSPAACVLPYALLSTSMAFFLFGFQTHEKTILLPLLPLTLLISTKGDEWGAGAGRTDWEWAVMANNVATFSTWPLLQRDGLALQYTITLLLWNWAIGHRPFAELRARRHSFVAWVGAAVHLAMMSLHALELLSPFLTSWTGPLLSRYPDLFPVLNVLLCTPCFLLVWLWSMKRQVEVGFACGIDLSPRQRKGPVK